MTTSISLRLALAPAVHLDHPRARGRRVRRRLRRLLLRLFAWATGLLREREPEGDDACAADPQGAAPSTLRHRASEADVARFAASFG